MPYLHGQYISQEALEDYWERKADEARDDKLMEQAYQSEVDKSTKQKAIEGQGMEGYKEVRE